MKSLAIKYRPKTFEDVVGQEEIKSILINQIETNTIKNGYLFCGGAGTGKTTCARIFANVINKGKGTPIELDAASNNSVDNIRDICEQAQTKALDAEYKVFILDECHSLSNQAWQAMLKTLEEPPAKSIFIFCTTNPEKIPATILSRVQRYNFQKLPYEMIYDRLYYILGQENLTAQGDFLYSWTEDALSFIAKLANGGMRDGITLLDKCLSYRTDLTEEVVVKALNVVDYELLFELFESILGVNERRFIELVDKVYLSGMDLKQFVKDCFEFVLDLNVYRITNTLSLTKIPVGYQDRLYKLVFDHLEQCPLILDTFVELNYRLKNENNPKYIIIAEVLRYMEGLVK